MRIHSIKTWPAFAVFSILTIFAVSLLAQLSTSLIIAGQGGSAKVVQVGGHNYVEVEGLARLTNSSISFSANQIVLTMPGSSPDATNSSTATSGAGFSKDFVTAGIEAMAQLREWHFALRNAIQRGYPLGDDWLGNYRNQTQQAIRLASVAINTIAPNSLDNDPLDQKIRSCAHSLASMATANQFIDDGSCQ